MTVANQTNRIAAVGNAAIGQEVPFPFPITATSDLLVKKRIIATGVETTLDETTNYTVVISGDIGGTLTTVTAIEVTEQIHIIRSTPLTQSLDLVTGGSFNAENIEDALDKGVKQIIDKNDAINRCLRLNETDANSSALVLPNTIARAGQFLAFDSDGNITVADSVDTSAFTVSAFAKTYLDDADAPTTRATLGTFKVVNVVEDYGAVGDDTTDDTTAIRNALTYAQTFGLPLYFPPCSVRYKITDYLEITTDGTRIICSYNQSPIRQDTWGKPVFWVQNADDVSILEPYLYSNETRSAIAGDSSGWGEGTLAAQSFSAGIYISGYKDGGRKGHRFYTNHWYAEGFVNGIFCRSGYADTKLLDMNYGDGWVKNVDFGLFISSFKNTRINSLHGIDINETQGNPVHVLYAFGTEADLNSGLSIGQLSARNVEDQDHAFQIKGTTDIVVGSMNAVECSAVLSWQDGAVGSVGSISALLKDDGTVGAVLILTNAKIIINGLDLQGPFIQRLIASGVGSHTIINGAYIRHTGGVAYTENLFVSTGVIGAAVMEVYNPRIEFETAPTEYLFFAFRTDDIMRVFNPRITGIGAACLLYDGDSGGGDNFDADNSVFAFDPKAIDADLVADSIIMFVDTGPFNVNFLGETATAVAMETAQATPIVNYATYFTITNAGAQNITDFTRVPRGHRFTIEASGDSNTTFVYAVGQLETFNGRNVTLTDGDRIEFIERGGVICETWRSKVTLEHIVCNINQVVCNENMVVMN